MNDDHELLDLVDENDKVIGVVQRGDYRFNMGFLRAAAVLLQNEKGEFWIPTRQRHKKISPGGYDFSADEHVGSGEKYLDAAVRGLSEELRINSKPSYLEKIAWIAPSDDLPYAHTLYALEYNATPAYNVNDFSGGEWFTIADLALRLSSGHSAKGTLVKALPYLEDYVQYQSTLKIVER